MNEFERVRPYLEAALEYSNGTHDIEDIRRMVAEQKVLLITGKKCAMVYEVLAYPKMRVLHGFLCGGDLEELKSFDPYLVELAKQLGCKRVSIAGRHGWVRALKDIGFQHACSVVTKEIT